MTRQYQPEQIFPTTETPATPSKIKSPDISPRRTNTRYLFKESQSSIPCTQPQTKSHHPPSAEKNLKTTKRPHQLSRIKPQHVHHNPSSPRLRPLQRRPPDSLPSPRMSVPFSIREREEVLGPRPRQRCPSRPGGQCGIFRLRFRGDL